MKEILRQILEAEQAGRQAVALLEAEESLRAARAEGAAAAGHIRAATERRVEELLRQTREQTARECRAILDDAERAAECLRREAARRRAVAKGHKNIACRFAKR